MEERLDDAINVLRNHAESQVALHLGPVGPHGGIYSHTSPPQLDHLVRSFAEGAANKKNTRSITRGRTPPPSSVPFVSRLHSASFPGESTSRGNGDATPGFLPRSYPYARHGRLHQDRKVTCDECQ